MSGGIAHPGKQRRPASEGSAPTSSRAGADSARDGLARLPRWALVSFGAGLVGAAVSVYLVVAHFATGVLVCGAGDCHLVQSSEFATIGGVPIALLGLGAFVTLLALGGWRWWLATAAAAGAGHDAPGRGRTQGRQDLATLLAFGVALAGVLYSAYLFYLEVAVLGAICQWCVVSALCLLVAAVAEGVGAREVLSGPG